MTAQHDVDNYTRNLLHRKALALADEPDLAGHEIEDIEQQLLLDVIPHLHKAGSTSYGSLIQKILDREGTSMLRDAQRRCRAGRPPLSLDAELPQSDGLGNDQPATLHDLVSDGDVRRRALFGRKVRVDAQSPIGGRSALAEPLSRNEDAPPTPDAAQRIDVAAVVQTLPVTLRRTCALLAEGRCLSDVARMQHISRTTVTRQIVRIRAAFEAVGMHGGNL